MQWKLKAVIGAAMALSLGAGTLNATLPAAKPIWVPAWTASMWKADDKQQVVVENATVSFQIRVGADGDQVRLNLSNEYGAPLKIGSASVRIAGGPTVPVTFGGKATADVAGKARVTSDAAALKVKPFEIVEVSLYLPERAALNTVHGAGGAKTSVSATGDFTAAPFEAARKVDNRPLLGSLDVLAASPRPVVVAFGDSITDNTGCANDAVPACRWGDVLGRRFAEAGMPHIVVTQAISGNRILSMGSGPAAVDRFQRDVLDLPGVTHVVILEGINDIGGSGRVRGDGTKAPTITAEELIAGYRKLIAMAHSRGIKVMGLTILPYQGAGYYTEDGDAMRIQVNNWMRTSGEFDTVFDMEKVVADPTYPLRLTPVLHRGDYLHPNGAGETKMGEAIPLAWFR